MKKVKVVLIGAGSARFGRGTIADLLASEELNETDLTVTLVDTNEEALRRMFRFAELLKEHRRVRANIQASTDRRDALAGAGYVVTAVARKLNELWAKEFLVPSAFGFRHVLGENGGPGAAFHTLRSLHLMTPIAKDIEEICPDALLLNYTNPESRVCLGVNRLTKVRCVGLCTGAFNTLRTVARILGKRGEEIEITIGGINHFHWVLGMRERETGDDLYPGFRRRVAESDWDLEPLTRRLFDTFGLFPFPDAMHMGEYPSFAYDICGPMWVTHWRGKMAAEEGETSRAPTAAERIQRVVDGEEPLTEELAARAWELATPIIWDIELDRDRRELSVNVANQGFAVANLPEDAIVEIPGRVDAEGVHPVEVGPLPEGVAAMCRSQISIQELLVQAYEERSKRLLLQALAIDPVVDSIDRAERMAEEMLRIESGFLPEFV